MPHEIRCVSSLKLQRSGQTPVHGPDYMPCKVPMSLAELQEPRTYSLSWCSLQYDWDREWLPGHSSGTRSLAASRHLYETVLRKFVLRISNLKVQTSAAVNGLAYNAEEQRVTGLQPT